MERCIPDSRHVYEETGSSSVVMGRTYDHLICRYCRDIKLVDVETGDVAPTPEVVDDKHACPTPGCHNWAHHPGECNEPILAYYGVGLSAGSAVRYYMEAADLLDELGIPPTDEVDESTLTIRARIWLLVDRHNKQLDGTTKRLTEELEVAKRRIETDDEVHRLDVENGNRAWARVTDLEAELARLNLVLDEAGARILNLLAERPR